MLGFDNGQVVSQAGRVPTGYREQTDVSWYTARLTERGSPKQSNFAARPTSSLTIDLNEGTQDEEFPCAELSSSTGRALDDYHPRMPGSILEVRTSMQTPPSSSPSNLSEVNEEPRSCIAAAANIIQAEDAVARPALKAREGSQEPDYSMAFVANSDVLNSVPPAELAQMTAEEHNALLLSDPQIRKSTVVHPDFLEQYYRESRLHHLSTWKADLKSQLQALAAERSSPREGPKKSPGQRRYIMHVDFDSFFAAVSVKKFPAYAEKPAVVAHGGGSGSEIASCNYAARKFGVKNGMWMQRAQDLCPELKILPYDFPGYEDASKKFYDAMLTTGGVVQSVSIDEALVDISALCFTDAGTDGVRRNEGGMYREQRKADEMAQQLRQDVFKATGCAVSVGIGGNILQAKIALRRAKPAGQYQLRPDEVLGFIGNLEVQALPGIAWSIGSKLEEIGIKLVGDIRQVSREKLVKTLGPKTGEKLWEYARGIDKVEVGDQGVRKSVSAEVNWGVRFEKQQQVDEFLNGLCGELSRRLVKERVRGKQLTVKVMRRAADAPRDPPKHLGHGKCDTYNKSMQFGIPTHDTSIIAKEAITLVNSLGISPGELRGIGVQMQKLDSIRSGLDDSSQKRLTFKTRPSLAQKRFSESRLPDPIRDEWETADRPERTPQLAEVSTLESKPLNVAGTQFVLPTQVDPKVLAELPEDIRSKLTRQLRRTPIDEPTAEANSLIRPRASMLARGQSPSVALPPQSQLDPTILEALPEQVRKEVLAVYGSPKRNQEQPPFPNSPQKSRKAPFTKQPVTFIKQPVRRKRGGALFAGQSRNAREEPTLTQTNFVARSVVGPDDGATTTDTEADHDELDPDFLSALPEDIRREVVEQQRQARLQRTGGIDTSMHQRRNVRSRKPASIDGPLDRLLQLPPRPPLPAFTSKSLSALPDLRNALKAWFLTFIEEGPDEADTAVLAEYLKAVVLDEKNLDKAVAIVKWMRWILEEGMDGFLIATEAWDEALKTVEASVQSAAGTRGLTLVELR